jgi:hypothetical protein
LLAQTQKQKRDKKQGWNGSQGSQTNAVIKFLYILTTQTGATCNQPVELSKDWNNNCLEKQKSAR